MLLFLAPGFAEDANYCWDGSSGARTRLTFDNVDTAGASLIDKCGAVGENTTMTINGATSGATGRWDEAFSFDGLNDYLYNWSTTEAHFDDTVNFTIVAWMNTSVTAIGCIAAEQDGNDAAVWNLFQINAESRAFVRITGGPNAGVTSAVAIMDNGNWHMVTQIYYSNKTVQLWLNDTYIGSTQNALLVGNFWSANSRFTVGATFTAPVNWGSDYTGLIDEIKIYNYSIVAAHGAGALSGIENLTLYNNLTGLTAAPPPGAQGCDITLSAPADNDHNNDNTPTFTQSDITCYGGEMPTRCWVTMNTVQSGDNSSTLTNGTGFAITANTSKADASYLWNISCTNTTWTNTSVSRTLVIDTVDPILYIVTPANDTSYSFGTSNNFTANATDLYPYNISCSVENASGQVAIYSNSTPVGLWLRLDREFTSVLAGGFYNLSCNTSDSHTRKEWKADSIEAGEGELKIKKGGKSLDFTWEWSETPNFSELTDRIKWGLLMPIDEKGDVKVKFHAICGGAASVIEDSEYAGHFVCADTFFADFQDLEDQGFDVNVVQESWNTIEVEIEGEDVGAPGTWIYGDPVVGGLNWAAAFARFIIDTPPTVTLNTPINNSYYSCWVEPCAINFTYIPVDGIGLSRAILYANFSGAWASNVTRRFPTNNTINTFSSFPNVGWGTYIWNVWVNDTVGANATAAANWTIHVVKPALLACGGGNTTASLNFTFWNEETLVQMNGSMEATFWISNDTTYLYNTTFNGSWAETLNVTICIWPPDATFYVLSFQMYNFTDYRHRGYFLVDAVINNVTQETRLYLVANTSSDILTVTIQENGQNVENAYVTLQRYYPASNTYLAVEIERTDAEGEALFYVVPFNVWYRFIIVTPTSTTVTPPGRISTNAKTIEISSDEYSTWVTYSGAIETNCTTNETAKSIACVVTNPSNLGTTYRFTAEELNLVGTIQCSQTQAGVPSLTFTCTATNATNDVYYSVEVSTSTGWLLLDSGTLTVPFTPPLGNLGLIAAFILITGTAFLGLPHGTSGAALFALVGVVLSVVMQFMIVPFEAMIFIAVLVALTIAKAKI